MRHIHSVRWCTSTQLEHEADASKIRAICMSHMSAYLSHCTGACMASTTLTTASQTSGPIPSPGMSVTVCFLASPGEGTYVIKPLTPCPYTRVHELKVTAFVSCFAREICFELRADLCCARGITRSCSPQGGQRCVSQHRKLRSIANCTLTAARSRRACRGNLPRDLMTSLVALHSRAWSCSGNRYRCRCEVQQMLDGLAIRLARVSGSTCGDVQLLLRACCLQPSLGLFAA